MSEAYLLQPISDTRPMSRHFKLKSHILLHRCTARAAKINTINDVLISSEWPFQRHCNYLHTNCLLQPLIQVYEWSICTSQNQKDITCNQESRGYYLKIRTTLSAILSIHRSSRIPFSRPKLRRIPLIPPLAFSISTISCAPRGALTSCEIASRA